jgi:hypothetical protein
LYFGGVALFTTFICMATNPQTRREIHGETGSGGSFLKIRTTVDDNMIDYSREFQRAAYLTETSSGRRTATSDTLLADHGVTVQNYPSANIQKKAPHFKYY